MKTHSINLLLVDDNPTDLMIMREAFAKNLSETVLHTVKSGEDAMKFLRHVGNYANAPRPDLILLDINMPRKNGLEVLEEIKSDPLLLRIPVIILTTSQAEEDVAKACAAHANCYIRNPVDYEEFERVTALIEEFWFYTVVMPESKVYAI